MTAPLRLILPTLLVVLAFTGCKMRQSSRVADVPPPPTNYDMPTPPPATSADPFVVPTNNAPAPTAPTPVVAPVPLETPGATSGAAGGTYVVQKGETLWKIATKVYGDGQRWKDIAAANPGLNPNAIQAGQTITLP